MDMLRSKSKVFRRFFRRSRTKFRYGKEKNHVGDTAATSSTGPVELWAWQTSKCSVEQEIKDALLKNTELWKRINAKTHASYGRRLNEMKDLYETMVSTASCQHKKVFVLQQENGSLHKEFECERISNHNLSLESEKLRSFVSEKEEELRTLMEKVLRFDEMYRSKEKECRLRSSAADLLKQSFEKMKENRGKVWSELDVTRNENTKLLGFMRDLEDECCHLRAKFEQEKNTLLQVNKDIIEEKDALKKRIEQLIEGSSQKVCEKGSESNEHNRSLEFEGNDAQLRQKEKEEETLSKLCIEKDEEIERLKLMLISRRLCSAPKGSLTDAAVSTIDIEDESQVLKGLLKDKEEQLCHVIKEKESLEKQMNKSFLEKQVLTNDETCTRFQHQRGGTNGVQETSSADQSSNVCNADFVRCVTMNEERGTKVDGKGYTSEASAEVVENRQAADELKQKLLANEKEIESLKKRNLDLFFLLNDLKMELDSHKEANSRLSREIDETSTELECQVSRRNSNLEINKSLRNNDQVIFEQLQTLVGVMEQQMSLHGKVDREELVACVSSDSERHS